MSTTCYERDEVMFDLLNGTESQQGEYETLRRCRELRAGSGASSQESLGAGRPPLPQRCSSLERPAVPPGPAKSRHESKVNKKNALVLGGDGRQAALPDFHMAAPDMSKFTFFKCYHFSSYFKCLVKLFDDTVTLQIQTSRPYIHFKFTQVECERKTFQRHLKCKPSLKLFTSHEL